MTKGDRQIRHDAMIRALHEQLDNKCADLMFAELLNGYWVDLSPLVFAGVEDREGDYFALWAVRKTPGNAVDVETCAPADTLRQPIVIEYAHGASIDEIARAKMTIALGSLLRLAHRYDHFSEGANVNGA
ncbi:MAG: hypothetical protein ACYDCQ_17925 [Dehalococcoidia bacterium]